MRTKQPRDKPPKDFDEPTELPEVSKLVVAQLVESLMPRREEILSDMASLIHHNRLKTQMQKLQEIGDETDT